MPGARPHNTSPSLPTAVNAGPMPVVSPDVNRQNVQRPVAEVIFPGTVFHRSLRETQFLR